MGYSPQVMRTPYLSLVLLIAAPLAGCEDWPLYLNLPQEQPTPPENDYTLVDIEEDEAEDLQVIDPVEPPTRVTASGSLGDCGFDLDADEYDWPLHPYDEDGDGVVDGEIAHYAGWYTGEVDWYRLESTESTWVVVDLQWTNAPEAGRNAPVLPELPDGPWASESDLDFLVFEDDAGLPGAMISDVGFSARYPELSPYPLGLVGGEPVLVAVACHHALGSDYSLQLTVADP